jgi:hypothetical protein
MQYRSRTETRLGKLMNQQLGDKHRSNQNVRGVAFDGRLQMEGCDENSDEHF